MGDHALGIDHEDPRHGDAIPAGPLRIFRVGHAKGLDYLHLLIGQKSEGDFLGSREPSMNINAIVGHDGHVIAKGLKLIENVVPGDRLVLAVGSPIQ